MLLSVRNELKHVKNIQLLILNTGDKQTLLITTNPRPAGHLAAEKLRPGDNKTADNSRPIRTRVKTAEEIPKIPGRTLVRSQHAKHKKERGPVEST